MTTSTDHRPNHHADQHAFRGVVGLLAGLSMTIGREREALLATDLTQLTAEDRLVDVGCGPGSAARFAARRGAHVTGIDPASVMLDLARTLTRREPVEYLDGAAEALPIGDAEATIVWALATVHHWPDLDGALPEIVRVLTPGGRFLAMERLTLPGARGLASHGWTDEQAQGFADLCRAAGFTDVTVATHPGRRRLVSVLARTP
ncbi:MAG: class I SAM-dependent methyltransferase [Acidimicrobiales bacterium]